MMNLRIPTITVLLLTLPSVTRSQPAGLPFIQHYAPTIYQAHPESRAIVQDNQGILYVGNQHGLLAFDGSNWQLTPVPGQAVRSLAIDSTNTVYIGTETNFGYLHIGKHGKRTYVSLSDKLAHAEFTPAKVTWTATASRGIYFGTGQAIYYYHAGAGRTANGNSSKNHKFNCWKVFTGLRHADFVQNTLIVQTRSGQILRANEPGAEGTPKLTPLSGTGRLVKERVEAVLPFPGNRLLFVTCQAGLFVYDPQRGNLTPFQTQADDWLHRARVFRAIYVWNGMTHRYMIGSAKDGVRILDEQGHEIQRINESNGLHRNAVLSLFYDREKSLWVGTTSGLDRIEINLPVSRFESTLNVRSTVQAIRRHEGRLFIGTGLGLFGWQETTHQFAAVPGTDASCWSLLTDGPDLWAGGSGYLWRIRQNREAETFLTDDQSITALLRPRHYPDLLLAATPSGVRLYRRTNGTYRYEGNLTGIQTECLSLAESKDGTLWIGTRRAGFYCIFPSRPCAPTAPRSIWPQSTA